MNAQRYRPGWVVLLLAWLAAIAATTAAELAKPGDFTWAPELAPSGPVAIVISLPEQRAYVYRNGVRIGVSTISSGREGYETPSGIYTILQKRREHYSNRYDNAPMPFMQRLTWDGVALHAGALPGYPASHGCVRLPPAFAEKLFAATSAGTVVVVASASFPPSVVSPGLFSPVDPATGAVRDQSVSASAFEWVPDRSTTGPLTVLISTSDQAMIVFRNGAEIGRSPIAASGLPRLGTVAFMLLDGIQARPSLLLPDRPALKWLLIDTRAAPSGSENVLREAIRTGRLVIPQAVARELYGLLRPGATVVVTDEPLAPSGQVSVMTSDGNGPP